MIGTATAERQMSSVDSATSLGQLADDALLAVLAWRAKDELDDHGRERLKDFADWLSQLRETLVDPISVTLTASHSRTLPGLDGFGPSVPGSAFGIRVAGGASEAALVLDHLRSTVLAIIAGDTNVAGLEELQRTFEGISRAMLSTVEALQAPATRTTWASTSAF